MASLETPAGPARPEFAAEAGFSERRLAFLLILGGFVVFLAPQAAFAPEAFRLALAGSDDSMRLMQVRDLLAGQSWFDLTQHRYLPPDGVAMHWSRLVDVPLAAGMLALAPFFGMPLAERMVVMLWPLVLFGAYAGLVGWGVWRLFGPLAAGLAVFAAGQMVVLWDMFGSGRIDHHNIQIVLMAASALGFGLSERGPRAALASGAACGLSLAVGLETLPFLVTVALAFALRWVAGEGEATGAFRRFGSGLAAVAALAFAAQTSPSQWLVPVCDSLSAPWLFLTTAGGAIAAGLTFATARLPTWRHRLAAAAIVGGVLVAAFALLFPGCIAGPYDLVPQPFRDMWLRDHGEVRPLHRSAVELPGLILEAVTPVVAAAVAVTILAFRSDGRRRLMALLAALLWLGLLLAEYQTRILYMVAAFVPLAVGPAAAWLAGCAGARSPVGRRVAAALLALAMFGFPWMAGKAVYAALVAGRDDSGAAPVAAGIACEDPAAIVALNRLAPGLVLTHINLGPNILVQTKHDIVAAGYHRAPAGIVAALRAFTGGEEDARQAVAAVGADYLAICSSYRVTGSPERTPFALSLLAGASAEWLDPVELPSGPLRAWRVKKPLEGRSR